MSVLPTPTGQPVGASVFTTAASWQNGATTQATFNETVGIVTQKEGAQTGQAFETWYTNVWNKDPAITPNQAVAVFLLGYGVAKATGKLASFLSGSTYIVSSGNTPLASGSEGPGVAQAAAQAASNIHLPSVSNPLDFLSNIADFFSRLTQANTWIRIAEFALGGALILVGVAHMAKGTPAGQAAAKAVKTAGMAAAL